VLAGEEEDGDEDSARLRPQVRVEEVADDAVVLLLLLDGLGEAPRRGPARPLLGTPWRVSVGEEVAEEKKRNGGAERLARVRCGAARCLKRRGRARTAPIARWRRASSGGEARGGRCPPFQRGRRPGKR
jgi:hypothetical protein